MSKIKDTQAIFSALVESKRAKNAAKKQVSEAKEVITEAPEVKMFTGCLLKESMDMDNDVVGDIIDNIQVVTDPDKTVAELEVRADEIQDAIEDSPEGEAAFSDEYVGDTIYACPVCGESFFADEEYQEGDKCPVCRAEPNDGFLAQGVVAPLNTEIEKPEEEAEVEVEEIPEESEEEAEAVKKHTEEVEEEEAEEVEESNGVMKESPKNQAKRIPLKRSSKTECVDTPADIHIEVTLKDEDEKPKAIEVDLDDSSFSDVMHDFVAENYGDCLQDMYVDECYYDPAEDQLELECKAVTVDGVKVPVTFIAKESACRGNRATLLARDARNVFKAESKVCPFIFSVSREDRVIKCESLRYSYVTNHSKAGKVKVEGYCRRK